MPRRYAIWPPAICLVAAGVISGIVFFAGPQPVLHEVAAVTRMPMPGSADVVLRRGQYGLYFGQLDAPTRKVMGVPSLSIDIVPPAGAKDPAFFEVAPRPDAYVDGYHTVEVAIIDVTSDGVYQIGVKSPEQSGGSFSIGEPPQTISAGRNVLRAWPLLGPPLGIGIILSLQLAMQRRRGHNLQDK